jgi:ATP-dependent Clp protease ATP-binding subunit ClpX
LFIAGGALMAWRKIISKRLNRQAVGYSTSKNVTTSIKIIYVPHSKISRFWIDSRNRLPVLTHMDPLRDVKSDFDRTKKCVNQTIQKLFAIDDVDFTITDEALIL